MKSVVLFSLVSLVGCADVMTDDDVEVTATPKIATNALTPATLWSVQLNPSQLTATNLNTMATSPNGRSVLTYVVGCALNAGHNVTATVNGVNFTFNGAIGLADGWTSSGLTPTQEQWVSGCVLSRLNRTGATVSISMRGSSTALAVTPSEASSYTDEEGAFFGSIFYDRDFYVASCQGTGKPHTDRLCAQPDEDCGLDFRGACTDVCTSQNGYYVDCSGSNAAAYGGSVTTFLVP